MQKLKVNFSMNVLLTLKVSATMTTLQINLSNKVHQARLIILMLMRRLSTLLFVGHMCCVVLVPAVAFCTLVKINFATLFSRFASWDWLLVSILTVQLT